MLALLTFTRWHYRSFMAFLAQRSCLWPNWAQKERYQRRTNRHDRRTVVDLFWKFYETVV